MGHIFISYSHKDKEYVHKLQEALQSKGFDAWIDERIDYGDEWLKVIEKQLDGCDAFIVVMSKNSHESDMVQNEITRARDKKKTIFPLLLDGEHWLVVQAKQYVDVSGGLLPPDKFYDRLSRAISKVGKFPLPLPMPVRLLKGLTKAGTNIDSKRKKMPIVIPVILFSIVLVIASLYLQNYKKNQPQKEPTPAFPSRESLDKSLGISRIQFSPSIRIGEGSKITQMVASESDLYLLNSTQGNVLRASLIDNGLKFDNAFDCAPGRYGNLQVGSLVDILVLPKTNAISATILGIDVSGNLLYCSPVQAPQVFPLLYPLDSPITNWGEVTAFALDNESLYVLDASSRAVWIYTGAYSVFKDAPYFYFGNQIPEIQDAIDLAVTGDNLYLLHEDGRLTTCTFSRIPDISTRCNSPAQYIDPFPAHSLYNVFGQAHFTQMTLAGLPDNALLLLDAGNQRIFRFNLQSIILRNILEPPDGDQNLLPTSPVDAMAISPNNVLYLALDNRIYISTDLP